MSRHMFEPPPGGKKVFFTLVCTSYFPAGVRIAYFCVEQPQSDCIPVRIHMCECALVALVSEDANRRIKDPKRLLQEMHATWGTEETGKLPSFCMIRQVSFITKILTVIS